MSDLKVHPKFRPQHYVFQKVYLIPLTGCQVEDYEKAVAALDLIEYGKRPRCPKHRTYRGIRKPTVDCAPCRKVYRERHRS